MRVGKQFWDIGEKKQEVFLGSIDDGLQQIIINEQQRELEPFDDDADLSDEVLLVLDEVIDELD